MRARRGGLVLFVAVAVIGGVAAARSLSHPSLEPYASLWMKASPSAAAGPLRARYFGATTIQLDDGETAIMVDGFFSRPGPMQLLLGEIEPDPARIGAALSKGKVGKLAVVLVAHSHHDHAMDSAVVAGRTGAMLAGSASTANIARGAGFAGDRVRVIRNGDVIRHGRFSIEVFESPHSPDALFPGEIAEPLRPPRRVGAYKEGGSYSFLVRHDRGTVLIHPSANFRPGIFKGVKADVLFLGIGALGKQGEDFARAYWREVVQASGARLVIPIHWDDFTRSLDKPLVPMPLVADNFGAAMERILRLAKADGIPVRFAPLFDAFDLARNEEKPATLVAGSMQRR